MTKATLSRTAGPKKTWAVVADYLTGPEDSWLDDFIQDNALTFLKVTPKNRYQGWHFQIKRTTGFKRWIGHFQQARAALAIRPDGIVTSFPQLAMATGVLKRLMRRKTRIIAHHFNLGRLPAGVRQTVTRFAAKGIERFIVHSPSEVAPYAAYLGVPEDRVRFVPLQRAATDIQRDEDGDDPFIVSMGSAHRDYPTLISAVDALQIPTIIVTRPADVGALPKSDWVSYKSRLSAAECHMLLARSRLSVTPIANLKTASGQITFIDALRLGVPTIATQCPGTDGYISHGKTGILVRPFDVEDLQGQIARLWNNAEERASLSQAAVQDAQARFTDEASAAALHGLILEGS